MKKEFIYKEYRVEQGVEIPPAQNIRLKYPFNVMQIGDSFSCDIKDRGTIEAYSHSYGKRHKMKFVTRSIDEKTGRLWRIE